MTSIFHSGLSKDLYSILNNSDDFNVIIQVGDNQNIKEFHAHSVILRARSPYFKSAFSTKWITKKNDMITFKKPNITPPVFDLILKYIYTGELDLNKQPDEDILGLLVASDELLIEELFEHVQDYLIEKRQTWIHENFVLVLHSVFDLVSCKKLRDYCIGTICEDAQPFITSKDFLSLDKEILHDLFERNDLQIEEVVAWDCLIKWGIEQTPCLESKNSDSTKWCDKDYEALKETLSSLIPLIRFVELSPIDYFDKVRPYRAIIPNHVYDEVEEFYFKGTLPKTTTLPPRTGTIQQIISKIIKPELSSIIINWINRKKSNSSTFLPRTEKVDIDKPKLTNIIINWIGNAMFVRTEKDPLYRFKLIYRGSRDGINSDAFKNKCKGKVASLVLIKVRQSNKIFGGYSSIGFNSIGGNFSIFDGFPCYNSSDNFIFSFENGEDTQNMKISRVVNNSVSILDCDNHGFNFGCGSLCMVDQNLYALNYYGIYEGHLNTDETFHIEEIETYVVIKQ